MAFVDIHTHLWHPRFEEDKEDVVKRAEEAGVRVIIDNGLNPETNRKVMEHARQFEKVRPALGIYPIDAEKLSDEEIMKELTFIESRGDDIVALGEVGLDLKWGENLERQREVFRRFIELSERIKKPLIIHSRKAEEEVIEMVERSGATAIMHAFGGSKKLVRRALDAGCYFSIPPNCVFAEHFQMIIAEANINRLLTETDAPYMSPYKGERNEPAYVTHTIKKIAEMKGFEEKEVENNIFLTAQKLFL